MTTFSGVPAAASAFFTELEADNSRAFWLAHREVYEQVVRAPFLALLDALGVGAVWRVYRPQRDTRFGTDKTPYKTFAGAVVEQAGGNGLFLKLDARGLLVASGYPRLAGDQLPRYRDALAAASGEAFPSLVATVAAEGHRVRAGRDEPLKRVPRGYPGDHPRGEWLRWKGVEVTERVGMPPWLSTSDAPARITASWKAARPLTDWLDTQVGPSTLSAEERWSGRRPGASGAQPRDDGTAAPVGAARSGDVT